MPSASANTELVTIIDDDEAIRDSISMLLQTVSLPCRTFPDAQSFLDSYNPRDVGCLLLDIRMPGMSGLTLQDKLIELGCAQPIVFLTGHGDIAMAVEAIRKGAVDFVQKPFRDQDLLDSIQTALAAARLQRESQVEQSRLTSLYQQLTPREQEVMELVAAGKANKVIAHTLNISQRTVEIHRARVMQKMGARNLAQFVKIHMRLQEAGLTGTDSDVH